MLNHEICSYGNGVLNHMPQVVAVNKIDVWEEGEGGSLQGLKTTKTRKDLEMELRQVMTHNRLMWISAKNREGVDHLMTRLAAFVQKVRSAQSP